MKLNIIALPELLEAIFGFLDRKDLYRSCARVNHQWYAVSMFIIRKKRKAEFIKIPNICNNILLHLYYNSSSHAELNNYYNVCQSWYDIFIMCQKKEIIFDELDYYDLLLNPRGHLPGVDLYCRRKRLLVDLKRYMEINVYPHFKHDHEINKYYQDIISRC